VVHLAVDEIQLGNKRRIEREIIYHPGSVVMIPRLDRDHLILVRQFRYSCRRFILEFPAGTLHRNETPRHCAKRELIEEVGYRPTRLRELLSFYPTPGVTTEFMHLFLAEGLVPAEPELDEDELLEPRVLSLREIQKQIESGKIIDAKTILGFLYFMSL
jgi:ADP-ribose pyrophosphatase